MGKRPAEGELFDGNMGSILREGSAFYAKRRSASHGNGTRTDSSEFHLCDQDCSFLIGSCRKSLCCEPPFEERSAVALHAAFCGSRRWVTTSGDPVRGQPKHHGEPRRARSRKRRIQTRNAYSTLRGSLLLGD